MTLAPASSMGQRAFPVYPRLDRYFAAPSAEASRHRLSQCVLRGDGPALLLGAAGAGKSMLLEVIAAELNKTLRVVRIAGAQLCTRRALLQSILHGLGEPFRDREEGELRLALAESLLDTTVSPEGVALLVDEAQSLPVRLLEELRLLTNTAIDGAPRLRLLLAGTHSLDETFTAPELSAFNQRIAARCYLDPLNREQTAQYVRAHIAAAGADPDTLLSPESYEAIQLASDGLPRLINQVCDRALVLAVEKRQESITGASIQEAWSDLHQLAAPWQAPANASLAANEAATAAQSDESVLEFGTLDSEPVPAQTESYDDEYEASYNEVYDEIEPTELDEEPATSLTSAMPGESETGVWNADEGLRGLTGKDEQAAPAISVEEEIDEEDECIAYAFPVDPALTPLTTGQESESETPDYHAPQEDNPADPHSADLKASHDPHQEESEADEEPLAIDPFDEPFDEEEVVLDQFSDLEIVAPAATIVTNQIEPEFGRMFGALTPAVEGLLQDVSDRLEAPVPGSGFSLVDLEEASATGDLEARDFESGDNEPLAVETDPDLSRSIDAISEQVEAASTESDEILIVEDEGSTDDSAEAVRQDYAQLFASLRQG